MRRCFLCAADMLGPTDRTLRFSGGALRSYAVACQSCGLLLDRGADPTACRRDLDTRLRAPFFVPAVEAPYGLDTYTLRTAATALGRGLTPGEGTARAEMLAPHGAHAGWGTLYDLPSGGGGVALGVLCRSADLGRVLAGLSPHGAWAEEAVILVDGPPAVATAVVVAGFPEGGVRVGARPLGGDFAAQRNALHDLARAPWMFQLDADEDIAPATGALLPALVALAEDGHALSIGLARRNVVDGVQSDMYPDVQYRLNRTAVRYAGQVHERPALGGWERGFITLHGVIAHHLDGAHVRSRSRRYEAMDPGRGRLEETTLLLRPYAE